MLRGLTLNGCYRLGIIKRVQRGSITIDGGATSGTLSIESVVPENTIIFKRGVYNNDGSTGSDPGGFLFTRLALTSSTLVTASVAGAEGGGADSIVFLEVVEFYPGVIRVQRGTVTGTNGAATSINSVVSGKAFLADLGYTHNTTGVAWSSYGPLHFFSALVLSNTAVTISTSSFAGHNHTHGFQVVEILMQGLNQ